MTNYSAWDAKAAQLTKEAEEDDARQKAENDKALGLEGGPKGAPTEKAEKELEELKEHSEERKDFIDWQKKTQNEVQFTHTPQEQLVELNKTEVDGRTVRFVGSENVTYVLPQGASVTKLLIDKCRCVTIHVNCSLPTSTIELYRCDELVLVLTEPLGTVQADECIGQVRIQYAEYDHIGNIYHQNCPGLAVGWGGGDVEFFVVGAKGDFQLSTKRLAGSTSELATAPVRRGEGEFPVDLGGPVQLASSEVQQPEPECAPEVEERRKLAQQKREKGNEMFRANDFMQASMEYSMALELDPTIDTVWANRSQCWLKLGNHEKALDDAVRCTEVNPTNSKGWFRKGMSLHSMKRYNEAIPVLLEAEKLEPTNKQIVDAIKMAQLMSRNQASSG